MAEAWKSYRGLVEWNFYKPGVPPVTNRQCQCNEETQCTNLTSGLASSFHHPPPDSWWKRRCSLYVRSLMLVPGSQYRPGNTQYNCQHAYWSLPFSLHLLTTVLLHHDVVVLAMDTPQVRNEVWRVASGPFHRPLAQLAEGRVLTGDEVLPDWALLCLDVVSFQTHDLVRGLPHVLPKEHINPETEYS